MPGSERGAHLQLARCRVRLDTGGFIDPPDAPALYGLSLLLLRRLAADIGHPVSFEDLDAVGWEYEAALAQRRRRLRTAITRLRDVLYDKGHNQAVRSVRGVGYQLVGELHDASNVASPFPPTAPAPAGPTTPWRGRADALEVLATALDRDTSPIVISGPPGSGKTRLVQQALELNGRPGLWLDGRSADARRRVSAAGDRICIVDLRGRPDAPEQWAALPRSAPLLLLSWHTPRRVPLHIALGPLPPAEARQLLPSAGAPNALTSEDLALIERLDRLPLMLEYADSVLPLYGSQGLSARCAQWLDLLTLPAPWQPHHGSLRAAWLPLWETLGSDEREALAQLSSFTCDVPLELAEAAMTARAHLTTARAGLLLQRLLRASCLYRTTTGRVRLYVGARLLAAESTPPEGLHEAIVDWLLEWGARILDAPSHGPGAIAARLRTELGHLDAPWRVDPQRRIQLGLLLDAAETERAPAAQRLARLELLFQLLPDADRSRSDRMLRMRLLQSRGEARRRLGEPQGLPDLEQALTLAEELDDHRRAAWLHNRIGSWVSTRGEWGRAEDHNARARQLAATYQLPEIECECHLAAGLNLRRQGAHEEAEQHLFKASSLAHEMALPHLQGRALAALGTSRREQSRFAEAGDFYTRARVCFQAAKEETAEADCLANQGALAFQIGAVERAEGLLSASHELHRAAGRRRQHAVVLANLGQVAAALGTLERAETLLREALEMHRAVGDRHNVLLDRMNLGHLEHLRGRLDAAEGWLAPALAEADQHDTRWLVSWASVWLAALLADRDRTEEATRYLRRAESAFSDPVDPIGQQMCRIALAHIALAEGGAPQSVQDGLQRELRSSGAELETSADLRQALAIFERTMRRRVTKVT